MDPELNYFNYFTEIENFYQSRRQSFTLLSTLDWVLIESWKNAGIPLDLVLKGIDRAFATSKRKINSLGYCVGAVSEVVEQAKAGRIQAPATPEFSDSDTRRYLESLAARLEPIGSRFPELAPRIQSIRQRIVDTDTTRLKEAEQQLTALEEKLLALIQFALDESALTALRGEVERELSPFRSKMKTEQLAMIEQQMWKRKLLDHVGAPRLSLFYMT